MLRSGPVTGSATFGNGTEGAAPSHASVRSCHRQCCVLNGTEGAPSAPVHLQGGVASLASDDLKSPFRKTASTFLIWRQPQNMIEKPGLEGRGIKTHRRSAPSWREACRHGCPSSRNPPASRPGAEESRAPDLKMFFWL